MNVTFGLAAAFLAFCMGALGLKGKAPGSSYGATLAALLRGDWIYTTGSQTFGSPAFGPSTPGNPLGMQPVPISPGPGINPGGPFRNPAASTAGLQAPPPAGSAAAGTVTV